MHSISGPSPRQSPARYRRHQSAANSGSLLDALALLDDDLARRIGNDTRIPHELAGVVLDHICASIEQARQRCGIPHPSEVL